MHVRNRISHSVRCTRHILTRYKLERVCTALLSDAWTVLKKLGMQPEKPKLSVAIINRIPTITHKVQHPVCPVYLIIHTVQNGEIGINMDPLWNVLNDPPG